MFIDSDANQPLYRRISSSLQTAIATGRYPVGAALPTEIEISQEFGVCRQTVRDALRILSDAGLVRRRRRVGTVVLGSTPRVSFAQNLRGFEELLQYARTARLSIAQYGPALKSRLTRQLKLDSAEWVQIDGVRGSPMRPVGLTTVLVRHDCAPSRSAIEASPDAFSEVIERGFGVSAARIEQEITACALTKQNAQALRAVCGAPALRTLRRYFDTNNGIFLIAETVHPSDRFVYTMSFTPSVSVK